MEILIQYHLEYVKYLLLFISFLILDVYAQLQDINSCKDTFQKISIDSTFKHYYIFGQDTTFFNNLDCVIHPQPCDPIGCIYWLFEGEREASGEVELQFNSMGQSEVIKGKFEMGYLVEGTWISYYKNGVLLDVTNYKNGSPFGEHLNYDENGKLRHRCIKNHLGLCSPIVLLNRR